MAQLTEFPIFKKFPKSLHPTVQYLCIEDRKGFLKMYQQIRKRKPRQLIILYEQTTQYVSLWATRILQTSANFLATFFQTGVNSQWVYAMEMPMPRSFLLIVYTVYIVFVKKFVLIEKLKTRWFANKNCLQNPDQVYWFLFDPSF